MLEAAGVAFDKIKTGISTPNSSTRSCFPFSSSHVLLADDHIKCYAAKCTVTMQDIVDQLETVLDGSVIEIVIEYLKCGSLE